MQYKGKDEKHVAWVQTAKDLFLALRDFCKRHHTTGPQWNAKGGDVGGAASAGARNGGDEAGTRVTARWCKHLRFCMIVSGSAVG